MLRKIICFIRHFCTLRWCKLITVTPQCSLGVLRLNPESDLREVLCPHPVSCCLGLDYSHSGADSRKGGYTADARSQWSWVWGRQRHAEEGPALAQGQWWEFCAAYMSHVCSQHECWPSAASLRHTTEIIVLVNICTGSHGLYHGQPDLPSVSCPSR